MNEKAISADFPFESQYIEVEGSKMHYVDVGSGEPVLFLHGNPTSSYLWRNIIPHLTSFGRCIAPDLIGMGKSDKPGINYRFKDHVRYIEGFIKELDLKNITLVIHDWGSGLGFHYAMRHPQNVKGIAFMEAIIQSSKWKEFPKEFKAAFKLFRTPGVGWLMISVMNIFVKKLLPGAVVRTMTEEEMEVYRAPFKKISHRKPIRRWPQEIPIDGKPKDMARIVNTYNRKLEESDIPKLLFYAHPGGILRKDMVDWCQNNLKNLSTVDLGKGIHYLQEDHPHRIGKELAVWYLSLK